MGDSIMPSIIRATTTSGLQVAPDNSGSLQLQTNGTTTAVTIDTSQNVGIGTTGPSYKLDVNGSIGGSSVTVVGNYTANRSNATAYNLAGGIKFQVDGTSYAAIAQPSAQALAFYTGNDTTERMRIDSSGNVLVGTTTDVDIASSTNTGVQISQVGAATVYRSGGTVMYVGRQTNDGTLIDFRQAGVSEGSISVSGTTVSYNGGHLSRWSQLYNETTQVAIYRGTVLESVDAMCEWEKDGQPLPNEQATKTIVSTTVASKAVAGVFDMYDVDDEDNPYDFYVAQSGDFVIRIAQGVTVQNGDLLESAGDGTAKPQADDICRSSTIAKVTSNYVSATYEDGSYCVPCILMIG